MFKVSSRGNYSKTRKFIDDLHDKKDLSDLDAYGRLGVEALSHATPVDTGLTAASWGYRITNTGVWTGIEWFNTNLAPNGEPIAVLVQYGHATRSGSYVIGVDYINPAMKEVFDTIVNDVWKKVNAS